MKPRARRVTIAAAVLGVGVVGALMVAPGPVRDHVEAWRFQLTRETRTFEPNPESHLDFKRASSTFGESGGYHIVTIHLLELLANHSGIRVIADPHITKDWEGYWTFGPNVKIQEHVLGTERGAATSNLSARILTENGWRVLEQRFPRRAYVVIPGTTQ